MGKQTDRCVRDLMDFGGRIVTAITLEAHANLVAAPSEGGTPVDTGWARANWVPSVGRAFTGLSGRRPRRGERSRAGMKATNALARIAASYRIEQGPVFVTNNVPYINLLNDGSSQQAPSAFVQRAISKAVRSIDRLPPPQP